MLHKDNYCKGSDAKIKYLVMSVEGAWCQDELFGGKPPVIK
jgi:hypothetical protein